MSERRFSTPRGRLPPRGQGGAAKKSQNRNQRQKHGCEIPEKAMSDKEKSRKTAALKAMGALRTAKKNVLRAIWDGKDLQDATDCLTAARAQGVESWSQEDTNDLRTTPLIEAAKSRTGDN